MRRGEKRGRAYSWDSRPPVTYVELPCFGGPRDGETIKVQATIEQLRVPFLDANATWPLDGPLLQQAMYRRMWIGTREQFVYQGTSGG